MAVTKGLPMTEIQQIQLTDLSAPAEGMCGPEGCCCGSAEASADESASQPAAAQA